MGTRDPQELLETAKRNLDTFWCFGITSEWDNTMVGISHFASRRCVSFLFSLIFQDLFEKMLGLTMTKQQKQLHANHTPNSSKNVSPELQKRIQELEYLDIQLYDYAFGIFKARLEEFQVGCDRYPRPEYCSA
jgi:hypothetical protein